MKDDSLILFVLLSEAIDCNVLTVRAEFISSVRTNQAAFGLALTDQTIERLADHYELVQRHNPLLHLVGPCSPAEFATRHVLESLTILKYLPTGARFADIGPGAGFPSIPCLIARDDVSAVLIESKEKKSAFLASAASNLSLSPRLEVINRQFEEVKNVECGFVTCRALDKFVEKLPRFLKWSKDRTLLLFGGHSLGEAFEGLRVGYERNLMPLSQQRFLYVVTPQTVL